MSPFLMLRRIILPSAFRRALPAYGNEVIFMLHGSAVASVVTIVDLTGAARMVQSRYYTPYEAFLTAGAVLHGADLRPGLAVPPGSSIACTPTCAARSPERPRVAGVRVATAVVARAPARP